MVCNYAAARDKREKKEAFSIGVSLDVIWILTRLSHWIANTLVKSYTCAEQEATKRTLLISAKFRLITLAIKGFWKLWSHLACPPSAFVIVAPIRWNQPFIAPRTKPFWPAFMFKGVLFSREEAGKCASLESSKIKNERRNSKTFTFLWVIWCKLVFQQGW